MSFSDEVDKFVLDVGKANEKVIRSTAIQLWSAIIKASPVDTGRFRSNWFPSASNPSTAVSSNTVSESEVIARATRSVLSQNITRAFTLTNNLPYSEVIEFGGYGDGPETSGGFSKQAPSGVVRINVKRFNQLIRKNAAKFKV